MGAGCGCGGGRAAERQARKRAEPHRGRHTDSVTSAKWHKDSGPGADEAYMAPEVVERAWEIFARAEAWAGDEDELQDRIALAKLPILYLRLEAGPVDDAVGYLTLVDEFEHTAKANKVHAVKSGV